MTISKKTQNITDDTKNEILGKEDVTKKKTCFVIMPIANVAGYDEGHFGRVYEYILKPAIEAAGYEPDRADKQGSSNIILSIIESLIKADMVLCDVSAKNANVLYELGIRHAFEKPVVLVKDERPVSIFDISTIRYHQYSSSLRADCVINDIEKIKDALLNFKDDKSSYTLMAQANTRIAPEPQGHTIQSTEAILEAITALEQRIKISERNIGFSRDHLVFSEKKNRIGQRNSLQTHVVCVNNEHFTDGDKVYNADDIYIGTIVDIMHDSGTIVFENNGKFDMLNSKDLKNCKTERMRNASIVAKKL